MKRSTAKKSELPTAKGPDIDEFDDSAWFDVMRATLSPYWSARMEYTTERPSSHEHDKQDAA